MCSVFSTTLSKSMLLDLILKVYMHIFDEIIIVLIDISTNVIEEKTLVIMVWHLMLFKIQQLLLGFIIFVKYIIKCRPMHVLLIIASFSCFIINTVLTYPWTVVILKICCIFNSEIFNTFGTGSLSIVCMEKMNKIASKRRSWKSDNNCSNSFIFNVYNCYSWICHIREQFTRELIY